MAGERAYNVEDRIRELGEDPETAFARAKANGMAGDAPPPTQLPADADPLASPEYPSSEGIDPTLRAPKVDPFGGAGPETVDRYAAPAAAATPLKLRTVSIAAPANSGTIADSETGSVMPEFSPAPAVTNPAEPPASFSELFTANRHAAERDNFGFDDQKLYEGYAPIVRMLGLPDSENPARFNGLTPDAEARFGTMSSPSQLATSAKQGELLPFTNNYLADRPLQESLIVAELKARRAKDPNFAPGIPDTIAGLHALFDAQQAKKAAADNAVLQRSPGGITGFAAALGGGTAGWAEDPINLAGLAIPGGEGKGLLQIAARDALINATLAAVQQPVVAHNRAELGEDYTAGDFASNVAGGAAAGAVFGPVLHGVGIGLKALTTGDFLKSLPQNVAGLWLRRARVEPGEPVSSFFSSLNNHELAELSRDATGGKMTPDATSAANVLERAQDVGESSPYQAGPAGDQTHDDTLAQTIKALEDHQIPAEAGFPSVSGSAGSDAATPAAVAERPPAPSTRGRPQPLETTPADPETAIQSFIGKVDHVENATGNVHAKNPHSSASGPAQFTDGTFRQYYQKIYGKDPGAHPSAELKDDPEVQGHLLNALTRDNASALEQLREPVNDGNLYLMHFLGAGDGGKLFRADPAAAIEDVLPEKVLKANSFLRGKSASEVIAWAHGKMGGHVASVRSGAGPLEAATDDPRIAQLNDEALQLDNAIIAPDEPSSNWGTRADLAASVADDTAAAPLEIPPMYAQSYPASAVNVDADRFQFKSGGDENGVTDRLKGITQWNPLYAGRIVTWTDREGRVFVADGHQRVGLAQRLEEQGHPPIALDAINLRETDGVSPEDARVYAALKNIAEGTGTSVDAAKVIRDAGPHVLEHLPPKSALVRDGEALSRLSDRAFGAVYNNRVPADFAAVIGHLLPHRPEAHEAMIDLLAKLDPANRGQAESIVRQAIAAGIHKEEQVDLFGAHEHVTSLMLERAKIQERVLAELRKMRLVHRTAADGAEALEKAGSKIARERSVKEAQANAQAIETINRLAYRAGPVADILSAAARDLKSGRANLSNLARAAAERLRELDLGALDRDAAANPDAGEYDAGSADANSNPDVAAIAREIAGDDADGFNFDGSGRGGEAGEEGPQLSAERGDPPQPSLHELEQATERFSDPNGKAVEQQAESLVHDLKADVSRRDQIRAATEELAGAARGEFRAVEPFPAEEPGYHRFRYVAHDGTEVGGNYVVEGNTIEGFNVGDVNNRVELGPKEMLNLFRQLREENPDVQYVHGYRKTGARTKGGAGEGDIWFELTDHGIRQIDGPPAAERPNLAVDSEGKPLTVYRGEHGAGHGGEIHSRLGSISFSEDPKVAETYASSPNDRVLDKSAVEPRVVRANVEIRNPVMNDREDPFIDLATIRRAIGRDHALEAGHEFADAIQNTSNWQEEINAGNEFHDVHDFLEKHPERADELYFDAYRLFDDPKWVERLKAAGFDGAIHGGNGESALTGEYKVFDRAQIRRLEKSPQEPGIGAPARENAGEAVGRPNAAEGAQNASEGLDRGAETDPAIAERQAQEVALKTAATLKGPGDVDQLGEMGLHLFDHADQPTFRIGEDGEDVSAADLLKDLDDDDKAIKAIKDCL